MSLTPEQAKNLGLPQDKVVSPVYAELHAIANRVAVETARQKEANEQVEIMRKAELQEGLQTTQAVVAQLLKAQLENVRSNNARKKTSDMGRIHDFIEPLALIGDYAAAEALAIETGEKDLGTNRDTNGNYRKWGYRKIALAAIERGEIEIAHQYLDKCDPTGLEDEYIALYEVSRAEEDLIKVRANIESLGDRYISLAINKYFLLYSMKHDPIDLERLRELIHNSPYNDKDFDKMRYNSKGERSSSLRSYYSGILFELTHDPEDGPNYEYDHNHGSIHGVIAYFGPAIIYQLENRNLEKVHLLFDDAKKGVWFTETKALVRELADFVAKHAPADLAAIDEYLPAAYRGRAYAELFAQTPSPEMLENARLLLLPNEKHCGDAIGLARLYESTGDMADLAAARELAYSLEDRLAIAKASNDVSDIDILRKLIRKNRQIAYTNRAYLLDLYKLSSSDQDLEYIRKLLGSKEYSDDILAMQLYLLTKSEIDLNLLRGILPKDFSSSNGFNYDLKSKAVRLQLELFAITRDKSDLRGMEDISHCFNVSEIDIINLFVQSDQLDVLRDLILLQPWSYIKHELCLKLAEHTHSPEDYDLSRQILSYKTDSIDPDPRDFFRLYKITGEDSDYQTGLRILQSKNMEGGGAFFEVTNPDDFARVYGDKQEEVILRASFGALCNDNVELLKYLLTQWGNQIRTIDDKLTDDIVKKGIESILRLIHQLG